MPYDKFYLGGILSRIDTTAQAEAAELLAVAQLGLRGIVAGQYPRNYPSIDVYAFDRGTGKRVDIQVKYCHSASSTYLVLGSFDADFLVAIRMNAGRPQGGREAMQEWVVPMDHVRVLARPAEGKYRLQLAKIPDEYLRAWHLIEHAVRPPEGDPA